MSIKRIGLTLITSASTGAGTSIGYVEGGTLGAVLLGIAGLACGIAFSIGRF